MNRELHSTQHSMDVEAMMAMMRKIIKEEMKEAGNTSDQISSSLPTEMKSVDREAVSRREAWLKKQNLKPIEVVAQVDSRPSEPAKVIKIGDPDQVYDIQVEQEEQFLIRGSHSGSVHSDLSSKMDSVMSSDAHSIILNDGVGIDLVSISSTDSDQSRRSNDGYHYRRTPSPTQRHSQYTPPRQRLKRRSYQQKRPAKRRKRNKFYV